ncbi:uncharacterized protein E6C27_scaffold284G00590 [Cucumis melo var. makuwa]|uniref:Uncharacterized protein n=2 Tax=Cucumis melo TaxID=3656 RepID=A0A5A7TVU3_CUCMM|nr:uncharacterized protein E6C27_scaffold284G00590 [Cucumis melo var. makuwa]
MRHGGSRRKRSSSFVRYLLVLCAVGAAICFLMLNVLMRMEASSDQFGDGEHFEEPPAQTTGMEGGRTSCATVEQMGDPFKDGVRKESLRAVTIGESRIEMEKCGRKRESKRPFHLVGGGNNPITIVRYYDVVKSNHDCIMVPYDQQNGLLELHRNLGASRVRQLPPEQFCKHGFVMGKSSEAGFGNEMYKILTAGALSIMLNRSLIIGQTRGKFPFGDYISYSDISFTLKEIKHLWRLNGCVKKFNRRLIMRIDDFEKPAQTNVLCSNWKEWEHPIIWFQGTTDAVAAQFFLKNIHPTMRAAASNLFGWPEVLESRPNVFGELMRVLISPSKNVEEAVFSVLKSGADPDISLHMRMLMNRSVRGLQAAVQCIRKAMLNLTGVSKPRLVLVSDTPNFVKSIVPILDEFAEVIHFDYEHFRGNISGTDDEFHKLDFRVKDWGPSPRWVAFVDFFLASRAKHAVISGAHRRVGTTYAQLIAALAAANNLDYLGNKSTGSDFSFLSSFQSNLLREGLKNQVGWGHIWNRFAGPLSCSSQPNQCAITPLLPPAWWDGIWQSPIPRDIKRMENYGVHLTSFGTVDEDGLRSFCYAKKNVLRTIPFIL